MNRSTLSTAFAPGTQPPGLGAPPPVPQGMPASAGFAAEASPLERRIDRMLGAIEGSRRHFGLGRRAVGDLNIYELAQYSPQLALARYQGVQLAPQILNIRASFVDATPVTDPTSFDGPTNTSGNIAISQPTIVDQVMYEIDAPNAFAGNIFKSMSDFFYSLQSGILATLEVTGAPRYPVAPYFTPIKALLSGLAEGWPIGWVLGYTQSIMMQFNQNIPVPTYPTIVTVSFRLWQPIGTDDFQMMTAAEARSRLLAAGIAQPPAMASAIPGT